MIAQRAGTTALRRLAGHPNAFFTANVAKFGVAKPLSTSQARPGVQTEKISNSEAASLLAAQRLRRPVSPHLAIYDKGQTWFGNSILTRFTGGVLSGSLYAFAAAYLAAPYLGWHLESASLVAAFGALPVAAKVGLKTLAAWPFAFHVVSGTRYLIYDLGIGFARKTVIKTEWYILGTSIVGALGLVLFL
ncbi:hypothetical protein VTJ83DRAFT_1860 [Remersonia thermophila]|uniref:Uncharacterized protein n=1 Tax=Remersonia thermophila TaxID=72144 RepID=A0ABR4DIL0_9PEZI